MIKPLTIKYLNNGSIHTASFYESINLRMSHIAWMIGNVLLENTPIYLIAGQPNIKCPVQDYENYILDTLVAYNSNQGPLVEPPVKLLLTPNWDYNLGFPQRFLWTSDEEITKIVQDHKYKKELVR